MNREGINNLFVIPTMNFGEDWLTNEEIVADILEQNQTGGYTEFVIWYPSTGIFSDRFPSLEEFAKGAERFKRIREEVEKHGLKLGWWLRNSINSGPGEEFQRLVKSDGTKPPYSNCPLGKQLQKRLSEAIATFAKIAKPFMIIFDDDFSVAAQTGNLGCFCDMHLKGFTKRIGKNYTREELVTQLTDGTPESLELLKEWRDYSTDTLVELATVIRQEVDKETPEIPICHMQPGNCDCDGPDSIYRVSKALAGDRHIPFSRIASSLYECNSDKNGAKLFFWANNNYCIDEPIEIRLVCEKGVARISYDECLIKYSDDTKEYLENEPQTEINYGGGKPYWGSQHAVQINNFYNSILGTESLEISGKEALKTQELICKIYNNNDSCLEIPKHM